jgi:hypothetical protein
MAPETLGLTKVDAYIAAMQPGEVGLVLCDNFRQASAVLSTVIWDYCTGVDATGYFNGSARVLRINDAEIFFRWELESLDALEVNHYLNLSTDPRSEIRCKQCRR